MYAYQPDCSRLDPLVHKNITRWRLRRAKLSSVRTGLDIANAFPSSTHASLLHRIQHSFPWCDRPFHRQHRQPSRRWQCTDVYHPIIDQWHQQVLDPSLQVTDPVSLRSDPMVLSSYADDVDRFQVRSTPTAIAERVNFSNDVFTSVLAVWYGTKERTVVKRLGTPTSPLFCLVRRRQFTKIKGMLHHFNGSNTSEAQARVLAAKRGHCANASSPTSSCPIVVLRDACRRHKGLQRIFIAAVCL